MTSGRVQAFIDAAAKKHLSFCYIDTKKKKWKFLSSFPAWTSPQNIIHINKKMWNTMDGSYKLFTLLHEIGHIIDPSSYYSSMTERELFAQVWAMRRSKSLGLKTLSKQIKNALGMWEYLYDWQSDHRRYILASRLAKKRGLI